MLKTLERKKGRREQNAFLAEGARLIEEALSYSWEPVQIISSPEGMERSYVADLVSRAESQGAQSLLMHPRLLAVKKRIKKRKRNEKRKKKKTKKNK